MNREFTQSSASARSMFAAVAIVITVSIGGFIDYLASDYEPQGSGQVRAKQPAVVVARR